MTNRKRIRNNSIYSTCRACNVKYGMDHLSSLFRKNHILDEQTTLAKLLSFCADIAVLPEEHFMPKQICAECTKQLLQSYHFKKIVQETNVALRSEYELSLEAGEHYEEVAKSLPPPHLKNTKRTILKLPRATERPEPIASKQRYDVNVEKAEEYENVNDDEMVLMQIRDSPTKSASAEQYDPLNSVHCDGFEAEDVVEEEELELRLNEVDEEEEEQLEEEHVVQYDEDDVAHEDEPKEGNEVVIAEINMSDVDDNSLSYKLIDVTKGEDEELINDEETIMLSTSGRDESEVEEVETEEGEYLYEEMEEEEYTKENVEMLENNTEEEETEYWISELSVDDANVDWRNKAKNNTASLLQCHFFGQTETKVRQQRTQANNNNNNEASDTLGPPKQQNPDFKCHICNKQLSNSNSHKYHMRLHSDETPYVCSLCGEGFKTRNAYDGHITTHDPNNPNKCKICGKMYRQASSLRSHLLTHTGQKPYRCEICGKGMTQKSGYKKHMLVHSGEKPHKCDECGRSFRYSSNLITHRRGHSHTKPFECEDCNKCFTSKAQLNRHRIVHSDDKPFECQICEKSFKRRVSLLSHIDTHDHDDAKLFKVEGFESE